MPHLLNAPTRRKLVSLWKEENPPTSPPAPPGGGAAAANKGCLSEARAVATEGGDDDADGAPCTPAANRGTLGLGPRVVETPPTAAADSGGAAGIGLGGANAAGAAGWP